MHKKSAIMWAAQSFKGTIFGTLTTRSNSKRKTSVQKCARTWSSDATTPQLTVLLLKRFKPNSSKLTKLNALKLKRFSRPWNLRWPRRNIST